LTCVARLADCDSLPHDVEILVEAVDGRVLARARWRFRAQDAPADRAWYVRAPLMVPMPNPPASGGRATIPMVHASWGQLKLLYRTPAPGEPMALQSGVVDTISAVVRVHSDPPKRWRRASPLGR